MDIKIIFFVAGLIIFALGLFRFIKEYKNKKSVRLFGMIAYGGFAVMMISGIMLAGSILSGISTVVKFVVLLATFSIAGRLLLEPGFKGK